MSNDCMAYCVLSEELDRRTRHAFWLFAFGSGDGHAFNTADSCIYFHDTSVVMQIVLNEVLSSAFNFRISSPTASATRAAKLSRAQQPAARMKAALVLR